MSKGFQLEGHNDLCVGIDLGTTNSVVAVVNQKANGDLVPKVVDMPRSVDSYRRIGSGVGMNIEKRPTLPSCVYYRRENGFEPIVGDFAKRQYALKPYDVAISIKSQMGEESASGLSEDLPDKTPAEISAVIIKHIIKNMQKIYRTPIDDVVITVPANFTSSMCQATLNAAELAGIKTRNSDGSERPILLSEPNAVIYDLINQIHNGEIPSQILDLSTKKTVLVFDIGGGTLDITIHEVERRKDAPDVLKVKEIATNRYTRLGGDDFDEVLAGRMYNHYYTKYKNIEDFKTSVKRNLPAIMAQFRSYAECVKLDLNERVQSASEFSSGWDDDEDEIIVTAGGNMGGIGYAYEEDFTQEDIEEIFSVLMGNQFCFADYKKIEQITDTKNIIYPILDTLYKAEQKLGVDMVSIDAVVLNGGMSKFYIIQERLKEFFGMDPIIALDPDLAVARGAAVYHYYLHKHEALKEDMRLISGMDYEKKETGAKEHSNSKCAAPLPAVSHGIEWDKSILNDSLYLGVRNGMAEELIPTGAELPYTSNLMTGFYMEAGQNQIAIPVKSRNLDGSYSTIAKGRIVFRNRYPQGAYVSFKVHMGCNKILSMQAWTSLDAEATVRLEEGNADIVIGSSDSPNMKGKISAPKGSALDAKAEISRLIQLCQNLSGRGVNTSELSKRIAACVDQICAAKNKADFAEPVLQAMETKKSDQTMLRLLIVGRKLASEWTDAQRRKLARICSNLLSPCLCGISANGLRYTVNIQAIYALGVCGDEKQLKCLEKLHDISQYHNACMYVHAQTGTQTAWLMDAFLKDCRQAENNQKRTIQCSAHAIGKAFQNGRPENISVKNQERMVKTLLEAIKNGNLTREELVCCIIALGALCDQRTEKSVLPGNLLNRALDILNHISAYYIPENTVYSEKSIAIAAKMIQGETLSSDEERFLLIKMAV